MARKDDIPPPPPPEGAAAILKGLAADLAAAVRARAETFLAEPVDAAKIERDIRVITLLARAGNAVQAMQAAEDRADARAVEARAQRALASVRALNPHSDARDETDMNETDPRLEDPKLMAEADKELERRLDALALEIKAENLHSQPAGRRPPVRAGQLGASKSAAPAPAH
jgi:hypothetical protein